MPTNKRKDDLNDSFYDKLIQIYNKLTFIAVDLNATKTNYI